MPTCNFKQCRFTSSAMQTVAHLLKKLPSLKEFLAVDRMPLGKCPGELGGQRVASKN
jgi:hypothetical protein